MKLPLDRAFGYPHPIRDLRNGKPLEIMQTNDLLYLFRQQLNRLIHFVPLLGQYIQLRGIVCPVIGKIEILHGVHRNIASVSVQHIDRAIFGNAAHPRAVFIRLLQGIELHPCRHEGILRGILCHKMIFCDPCRRSHDSLLITRNQNLVRRLFTGKRQQNQRLVRFVSVIHKIIPFLGFPFAEIGNFHF